MEWGSHYSEDSPHIFILIQESQCHSETRHALSQLYFKIVETINRSHDAVKHRPYAQAI